MFGNTFTSVALRSLEDSRKVRWGGLEASMVETEWVETFADANVLSNVAPLLPQGHGGGDVRGIRAWMHNQTYPYTSN